MKYDVRKDKSSDLNSTMEKPITLLKYQAIDGKEVGKSFINILDAKSEQKKVRVPKIKKDLPLSKTEIKLICSWLGARLHCPNISPIFEGTPICVSCYGLLS